MGYFVGSVSVEESLDTVVEYTNTEDHVRRLVSAIEGRDTIGDVTEWQRLGDRLRHRVEWKADAYRGWLEANREGQVASISAGVHTSEEVGAQGRLDGALLELKDALEAVDAADIRKAEAGGSVVVETILKGLIRAIPAPRRSAMTPYLIRVPDLQGGDRLEGLRAKECVAWAREATEESRVGTVRLTAAIAEEVKHFEAELDAVMVNVERLAVDFLAKAERFDPSRLGEGAVPHGFQMHLNDAYVALKTAHKLAVHYGWDAVPWPRLLDRLFAVQDGP